MPDPILKWAGGKRQILDEIMEKFPTQEINQYHEPFFGGGAVFFREMYNKTATINDVNPRLINFYKQVDERHDELIEEIEKLNRHGPPKSDPNPDWDYDEEDEYGREIKNYYYQQRARFNKRPILGEWDDLQEAALLLYLNVTCYNGLYRENQSGEFNVPCGRHSTSSMRYSRIQEASPLLSDVDIRNDDFEYVVDEAEPGDLVYFDPPYDPNSDASSFSEYSFTGFDKAEQLRLRDCAIELDEKDVFVVISNAPSIENRYTDEDEGGSGSFRTYGVGARRAINSEGSERGEVEEVLISNVENVRMRDTTLAEFN
jgi:DNA adenine methylase